MRISNEEIEGAIELYVNSIYDDRFADKDNIMNRVRPLLKKRLEKLKEEGYTLKDLEGDTNGRR